MSAPCNDADDWNLVYKNKKPKLPAHGADQKIKATRSQIHSHMATLTNSEGYYIEYPTIMKHLVKAGKNPDMSEGHLVGMMDNILRDFFPQIKAMCLSMIGNQ